jgi:hypothetical protein
LFRGQRSDFDATVVGTAAQALPPRRHGGGTWSHSGFLFLDKPRPGMPLDRPRMHVVKKVQPEVYPVLSHRLVDQADGHSVALNGPWILSSTRFIALFWFGQVRSG